MFECVEIRLSVRLAVTTMHMYGYHYTLTRLVYSTRTPTQVSTRTIMTLLSCALYLSSLDNYMEYFEWVVLLKSTLHSQISPFC